MGEERVACATVKKYVNIFKGRSFLGLSEPVTPCISQSENSGFKMVNKKLINRKRICENEVSYGKMAVLK